MEAQKAIQAARMIREARAKTLSPSNYGKTVIGTIIEVYPDHILVEANSEFCLVYGKYKNAANGMKVKCIYATTPRTILPTLVFTEGQIEILGDSADKSSGIVIKTILGSFGVWLFFPEFGKVGYYKFKADEHLCLDDERKFLIAGTGPLDVHVYRLL